MAFRKNVFGGFNQSVVPTIACFNQATIPLGVDFDNLIAAMQEYVTAHVAPVWGTPATLLKTKGFRKHAWAMVFLDNADQPGALAYHDLTPDGLPVAKVVVKTTLKNKELVSVSASHELVEMLVDPAVNMMTTGPNPKFMYAYESADPVEGLDFPVHGIPMSNFVYPAYFETFRKRNTVQFDHMKRVTKPFQVMKYGYQQIFKHGRYTEVYGSIAKEKLFATEDRRGHRTLIRKAGRLNPADIKQITKHFPGSVE